MLSLLGGVSPSRAFGLWFIRRLIPAFVCLAPCFLARQAPGQSIGSGAASLPKIPTSVVLSGTVNQGVSSARETGNVTLTLNADGSTSEAWDLSSGQRSFVTYPFADGRNCRRTDSKGVTTEVATAGCFRSVPWFAPWLADKTVASSITTLLDGSTATDTAAGLQKHLYSLTMPTPKDPKSHGARGLARIAAESSVLVTFDAATHLATRVDFNEKSEANPLSQIETYVLFSEYRLEGGFQIPHRIQRYVQRSLQADLQINSVTIH